MNIDDVQEEFVMPPEGIPAAIFNRQKELMAKYHEIEKASGLMQTAECPVNIDLPAGQARLKDFMWRTTEELMESMDAYMSGDYHHAREEWADALHFMVELIILSGLDFTAFPETRNLHPDEAINPIAVSEGCFWTIYALGMAANCLKQKPWKQTHILTDRKRYEEYLVKAFENLIALGSHHGMSVFEMASYYFKKSRVNQFRQRSKY